MKKNMSLVIISSLIFIISVLIFNIVKTKNEYKELKNKDLVETDTLMHVSKAETKDEIIYEVIDNRKKLSYSWSFEKTEELKTALKNNMEIDLNLKLDILENLENKDLNSLITNDDKLIIAFEHHGKLPSKAKIRINVEDKYNEGELLYLYYLNEEKNQIEYIDSSIPVKNGHVEFEISHCSNYFLTASIVQDAVNNPKNVNLIIIVMVIVIIVLIASTLIQNKK